MSAHGKPVTYVVGAPHQYNHWRSTAATPEELRIGGHIHIWRHDRLRGRRIKDGDRVELLPHHDRLPDWREIRELLTLALAEWHRAGKSTGYVASPDGSLVPAKGAR